jgi:hypothetical protein
MSVLDACDWDEAGLTKEEVLGWWAEHKREDNFRRAQEADERRRRGLAEQARAKLSLEELAALGISAETRG